MNTKEKHTLYILGLFLIGSILFSVFYKKPSQSITDETHATTTQGLSMNVEVLSLTKETLKINIIIEYPHFTDIKKGSTQELMNIQFKKDAQALYEQTTAELESAAREIDGREVVFEKKLLKDKTYINAQTGIYSVAYAQYTDTGGAHGTFYYGTETINTKNGEKLLIADILKGEYTSALIQEIEKQIREKASTCLRCDSLEGELDSLQSFVPETFLLSDQGITFLFGAYDLASYAATSNGQEIFIDKDFLNPYILKNW